MGGKLQKLIPAQPTKSTRDKQKSWFHFWCSCGQNNFCNRNTKVKLWAGDVTGFKISAQLWQKSGRTFHLFHAFFFSLFEASTRLTRTQKHQQARLLPFRGFSSASATQMMNQSKNVDLIFFFTCAWLRPPREKNLLFCEQKTSEKCKTKIYKKKKRRRKKNRFFFSWLIFGASFRRQGVVLAQERGGLWSGARLYVVSCVSLY